jgi:sugar phosphate isomerase/epimerase
MGSGRIPVTYPDGKTMKEKPLKEPHPEERAHQPGCFSQIHAHIPLPYLRKKIGLFLEKGLNPEIYFNYRALEGMAGDDIAALAATLSRHGRRVTIHGPFYDLSPGAMDPGFRALTAERMIFSLERAAPFSPDAVVFHPGYDPLKFAKHREAWLRNSLRTWSQLLPQAKKMTDTWILIENIFEKDPFTLADLLARLPTPPFGFCLDTGHFNLFSDLPLADWLGALGPHLREVHLHDNDGRSDQHLPPGRGRFDFSALFREIPRLSQPVIGTVEAHNEPNLLQALSFLESRGLMP